SPVAVCAATPLLTVMPVRLSTPLPVRRNTRPVLGAVADRERGRARPVDGEVVDTDGGRAGGQRNRAAGEPGGIDDVAVAGRSDRVAQAAGTVVVAVAGRQRRAAGMRRKEYIQTQLA